MVELIDDNERASSLVAAIAYGIPIISVTIADDAPHLRRGNYSAPHDRGLECLVTLCLAGPASEQLFCGPITDGGDCIDQQMARKYLADTVDALRIGVEMARHQDAADKLVRTPWAQRRIKLIATALLRHGTLSGTDVLALNWCALICCHRRGLLVRRMQSTVISTPVFSRAFAEPFNLLAAECTHHCTAAL